MREESQPVKRCRGPVKQKREQLSQVGHEEKYVENLVAFTKERFGGDFLLSWNVRGCASELYRVFACKSSEREQRRWAGVESLKREADEIVRGKMLCSRRHKDRK